MLDVFKVKENNSTFARELVGGITTFLAMAYILAVNPAILSETGMDFGAVFTATALSSAIATFVMAFAANLPAALAPAMGLNAFFTYTVVKMMGCSYQFALTAVLIEGFVFIALSLTGVREAIIEAIPSCLKKSITVGIGLFITIVGLFNSGVCSTDSSVVGTVIGFVDFNFSNATALVTVIGLVLTIILYLLKIPGAILIGIIATTVIGIPFGVTQVPHGFSAVSLPSSPTLFAFDFKGILSGKFLIVLFTFLFSDMFNTIGTLTGVAEQGNLKNKDGSIKNVRQALLADAVGTVAGACLGTSTVSTYVESASGIAVGARTGLASFVTACFFLLSLFFSPVFALIPSCATAPALIFVGYMMMKPVLGIKFEDPTEGIPAFITISVTPFAYSISKGIAFGIIAYVFCKFVTKRAREVKPVTWVLFVLFIGELVFEAVN